MSTESNAEQQPRDTRSPSLWITVITCFGLIVLAALVVCVVLTLLGPMIGNVFSNIIVNEPGI